MEHVIVRTGRSHFLITGQAIAHGEQQSQCVVVGEVPNGIFPSRNESIRVVCGAEKGRQLRVNVIIETEIGSREFLFQNRAAGEHGQGRTFHGVRGCQQDLAVTFEECSRDMAGNTFGEGNDAIVKRNVNRATIQRCFPYFEDLFLVESHASQFEVKRLRWPRRFGRNGLLCRG